MRNLGNTGWGPPVAEPPRTLHYYMAVAAVATMAIVVVPIAALMVFIVYLMLIHGW